MLVLALRRRTWPCVAGHGPMPLSFRSIDERIYLIINMLHVLTCCDHSSPRCSASTVLLSCRTLLRNHFAKVSLDLSSHTYSSCLPLRIPFTFKMCFGITPQRKKNYYYREEVVPATRYHHHHHGHHHPARASYHSHTSRHSHYGHSPRASYHSHHSGPVVYEKRTSRRYV